MEDLFRKFFAVELGLLGVCSILYAVAALLGWKYVRPRRWWDWEPSKNYTRKNAPAVMVVGIVFCYISRLPFLDMETWAFQPAFWLFVSAAVVVSIMFSCIGSKKFQTMAKAQNMWFTRSNASRRLDTVGLFLICFSNLFTKLWWLQGAMIQTGLVLFAVTSVKDYFAPAGQI